MPVEIKKLIIKAVVEDSQAAKTTASAGGLDQEAIVKACVKQVLQILKQSKQR